MNNTILCIGFSMKDPFISELFLSISECYHRYKSTNYIITTDDTDFSKYNFQSIKLNNYGELSLLLIELSKYNMGSNIDSNNMQKDSKVYITKRFLRRRCRYSPVGSPEFINILTGLTTYSIGSKAETDYINKISELKFSFERKIAEAAYNEKIGNTSEMLNILEPLRFSGMEESVRLLFLGIAYEKLDRIDEAIDSYRKILEKEGNEKLLKSAQFNLHICFEKKQMIDDEGFIPFLSSDIQLLGNQRIKDKALTMHIIMCIKEKRSFTYKNLLNESLDYEINANPSGYVKTMLSYMELGMEELAESELEKIFINFNKIQENIGVDTRVAILKKLQEQLYESNSELKTIIDDTLSALEKNHSDYTITKHLQNRIQNS